MLKSELECKRNYMTFNNQIWLRHGACQNYFIMSWRFFKPVLLFITQGLPQQTGSIVQSGSVANKSSFKKKKKKKKKLIIIIIIIIIKQIKQKKKKEKKRHLLFCDKDFYYYSPFNYTPGHCVLNSKMYYVFNMIPENKQTKNTICS